MWRRPAAGSSSSSSSGSTHSALFAELRRKSRQLESLNRELEQRVAERTEELEKRAETLQQLNSELARKNQDLDAIVKTAPDIIFSRRADGSRDYVSDRFYEYTGALPESAKGVGWLDHVHPDDKESSLAQWAHCVESGDNYECEYRLRGRDGQYRWFRVRAVPIRDQANRITRWYGTCSDIHDSKLVEHAMRESAAELERKVDERTAALRRLSNRLMTMQDDERRRIARELHDGLGQEMVALKMLLNGIADTPLSLPEYIGQATGVIDRATQQIRTLSYLLHPPLLDEVGLLSALRWYLEGLTQRSGIETKLEVSPDDFPRLALELETAMFRIIQEALTNVFRHSGAHQVWISLTQGEGKMTVKVRDDGRGIADGVVELHSSTPGVGIRGMSERAKELGGQLLVKSAHPGTIVEMTIPVSAPTPSGLPLPVEKTAVRRTSSDAVVGQATVS